MKLFSSNRLIARNVMVAMLVVRNKRIFLLGVKEARSSFSGLGVEVLKLQSRIDDKLRSPSYYIIVSTYDQIKFSHRFPSNNYYHSNGSAWPLILNIVDYLEI